MNFSAGFISMPGGPEWLVIFVVILIIFGPKNLPRIGQAIGRGIREFKDASEGIQRTIEEEVTAAERREKAEREAKATPEAVPAPGAPEISPTPTEHHAD